MKAVTHFSNSAGRVSESLIDHVWSNHPAKVLTCGQVELAASDHQLIWVDRVSRQLEERGKPRWLTKELEESMKERVKLRKKAKKTKLMKDEMEDRTCRNITARKMKQAKREHLRTKMEHLDKNSPDSWAAAGEYLGWRKPMSPTMLTQDGKVLTSGPELAEAMIEQYKRKERWLTRHLD